MSLGWIACAVVLPVICGLIVAYPFWSRRVSDDMGSIAGAGVILACVVAFIAREYGEILAVTRRCIDANVGCRFHPQPFVRYGIYGLIGMCQVVVVFVVGLQTEERLRARDRDTGKQPSS